jgi:hypothetical protein
VVATGLGGKATDPARTGLAVRRDPMAPLRLFTLECAILAAFVPRVLPTTFNEQTHVQTPQPLTIGEESIPIGSIKKRKD